MSLKAVALKGTNVRIDVRMIPPQNYRISAGDCSNAAADELVAKVRYHLREALELGASSAAIFTLLAILIALSVSLGRVHETGLHVVIGGVAGGACWRGTRRNLQLFARLRRSLSEAPSSNWARRLTVPRVHTSWAARTGYIYERETKARKARIEAKISAEESRTSSLIQGERQRRITMRELAARNKPGTVNRPHFG